MLGVTEQSHGFWVNWINFMYVLVCEDNRQWNQKGFQWSNNVTILFISKFNKQWTRNDVVINKQVLMKRMSKFKSPKRLWTRKKIFFDQIQSIKETKKTVISYNTSV